MASSATTSSTPSPLVIRTPARLLEWASSHPLLRVSRIDVPQQILPSHVQSAVLCDIRVNPKGRQPDDAIYHAHADIRRYVPRGLCLLDLKLRDCTDNSVMVLVSAMHKFSGGMGDEDDADVTDDQEWKRFFIAPLEQTVTIVKTSKENGEAAHYATFRFPHCNTIYHVAGSKHVHLLVRTAADIDLYREPRYLVARHVGAAVMTCLDALSPEQHAAFTTHMLDNRTTATFEILQPFYQHIEFFDFPDVRLKFISFTSNDQAVMGSVATETTTTTATTTTTTDDQHDSDGSDSSSVKLTSLCQDPRMGVEIARAAGFQTISISESPLSDMDALFLRIRNAYGKEGAVLYFIDSDGQVIGLLKKKTMWYILVRAIREKSKGLASQYRKEKPKTKATPVTYAKTVKRLKDIRRWLGFSEQQAEVCHQLNHSPTQSLTNSITHRSQSLTD
jgi:hypothetical protein